MKKIFLLASLTIGAIMFSSNEAKAQMEVDPKLSAVQCYYPSIPSNCQYFEITNISGNNITAIACGVEINFILDNKVPFLTVGTNVYFAVTNVVSKNCNGILRLQIGL